VPLGPEDGVPRRNVANTDAIFTVPRAVVERYLTTLSPEKMRALDEAIKFALDFP